jgi:Concanavalin A-like lectin/glucanases superfamily
MPGVTGYDITGLHKPLAYQSGTGRGVTVAGLGMSASSSQYATTTVSSGLSGNFGMWACAFRAGSGGTNETILSSDGTVSFWAILGFNSGGSSKPLFSLFDGIHNPEVDSSITVGVGLYTVGGVRNAGQLKIYLNGTLTGTASDTTTAPQTYTTLTLGTQGGGQNTRNMNGTIVVARTWSRPPTAAEFSRLQRDPYAGLIFPSDTILDVNSNTSPPPPSTQGPFLFTPQIIVPVGTSALIGRRLVQNPQVPRRKLISPRWWIGGK